MVEQNMKAYNVHNHKVLKKRVRHFFFLKKPKFTLTFFPACLVSYATEAVMRICHGHRKCSLSADSNTFGKPCRPDSRMYLKVVYTCGKYMRLFKVNRLLILFILQFQEKFYVKNMIVLQNLMSHIKRILIRIKMTCTMMTSFIVNRKYHHQHQNYKELSTIRILVQRMVQRRRTQA